MYFLTGGGRNEKIIFMDIQTIESIEKKVDFIISCLKIAQDKKCDSPEEFLFFIGTELGAIKVYAHDIKRELKDIKK